jgi:hypothetical protein
MMNMVKNSNKQAIDNKESLRKLPWLSAINI